MTDEQQIDFRFDEFNERRSLRGVEAARVVVSGGDEENWLWMSKKDIEKNIQIYGEHPELLKAKAAYCRK